MVVRLYQHQVEAVDKLDSGSVLCGGVGTGKSITALAYFYLKECRGFIKPSGELIRPARPLPLYIITTARKRDTHEWEEECARFGISDKPMLDESGVPELVIDSWNNIHKYESVEDAFFIFDEQRVVGSGKWVRSFLRIAKKNRWILLSATPGDTWMDYIPLFVANGFYKNRSEMLRQHAVYNRYSKYPKVDRWVDVGRLESYRRKIVVNMPFRKRTQVHHISVWVPYDPQKYKKVSVDRWDPWNEEPIRDISGACYLMRRVVNGDPRRLEQVIKFLDQRPKAIIFYNFDYELEELRELKYILARPLAEWNGKRHQPIPEGDNWIYLVQYTAGAEGWNCTETDTIIFFSQNYSYKLMTQAAGRIDRLNTPYEDLYYYHLFSDAPIDLAIRQALRRRRASTKRLLSNNFASREKHVFI